MGDEYNAENEGLKNLVGLKRQIAQQRRKMFEVGSVQRHLQPMTGQRNQTLHPADIMAELEPGEIVNRPFKITGKNFNALKTFEKLYRLILPSAVRCAFNKLYPNNR